jgi:dipeptidyl aminopeptidase/acylaminoacyl peptidase
MDERGRVVAGLNILTSLNGGFRVDRSGTKFAYVQTANFELPPGIPERFRRRFEHLPQATLQFGTLLRDVQSSNTGSCAITLGGRLREATPFRPAWSPNGRSVVFARAHSGDVHLFVASRVRPILRQITHSLGRDLDPIWSPDGSRIVFERHVQGKADLDGIRPDGSDLRFARCRVAPDLGEPRTFATRLLRNRCSPSSTKDIWRER